MNGVEFQTGEVDLLPGRFWDPHTLSSGYRKLISAPPPNPWMRRVKLVSHHHVLQSSTMLSALLSLPTTPSWHGVYANGQVYFLGLKIQMTGSADGLLKT